MRKKDIIAFNLVSRNSSLRISAQERIKKKRLLSCIDFKACMSIKCEIP